MRVLITGMSGYVGGVIARRVARLPEVEGITGLDVNQPSFELPTHVRFARCDIRAREVADLAGGHDAIVHAAYLVMWKSSMPARERDDINDRGVRNVAEAALAAHVKRFVHISSLAAYDLVHPAGMPVTEDAPLGQGDSPSPYVNGKAAAERIVHGVLDGSPMAVTVLRPSFVTGPHDTVLVPSLRSGPYRFTRTDTRAQYLHEDDLAEAVVMALRGRLNGTYNVVPDDALPRTEALRALGIEHVRYVPRPIAEAIAWYQWRWRGSPLHHSTIWQASGDFVADNARLRSAGWAPRYSSTDALRAALAV
jgi:UDP-glucose 4-epimerase